MTAKATSSPVRQFTKEAAPMAGSFAIFHLPFTEPRSVLLREILVTEDACWGFNDNEHSHSSVNDK
jgi:hypothetical protein